MLALDRRRSNNVHELWVGYEEHEHIPCKFRHCVFVKLVVYVKQCKI